MVSRCIENTPDDSFAASGIQREMFNVSKMDTVEVTGIYCGLIYFSC
jgi:hypothetical protein